MRLKEINLKLLGVAQIRSYVLAPYKLVKDVRTSLENHSPDNVLDGDIEGFINAFSSKDHSKNK